MKKKTLYTIIFWAAIAALAGAVGYLVYTFTLRFMAVHDYEQLRDHAIVGGKLPDEDAYLFEPGKAGNRQDMAGGDEGSEEESNIKEENDATWHAGEAPYTSPLDFDYLQRINDDIYAWIVIPHFEGISYPILQHDSVDWHYLLYSFDNVRGNTGAIYTHCNTAKTFEDFNTVIYGHNLIAGGMFTDLENYWDEEFLNEHRSIVIYTPDKALYYTVFAVVAYNNKSLDIAYDFTSEEDRQAFIDSIYEIHDLRSHVLTDVPVTTDDHLITLSTCMGDDSKRLLIVAVQTNVRE